MYTSVSSHDQLESTDIPSAFAGPPSAVDEIFAQPILAGGLRSKIEFASTWDPEHGMLASRRWSRIASMLLACIGGYELLARFVLHTGPARVNSLVSPTDIILCGVLMCVWMALGEVSDSIRPRCARWVTSSIWQTIALLFLIAIGYMAGLSLAACLAFTAIALLFLPLAYFIDVLAATILRNIQLVPHDARILVVGSRACAKEAITALRQEQYEIIGCLDHEATVGTTVADTPVLGTPDDLPILVFGQAIDLVLFAMPLSLVPRADLLIDASLQVGIPVGIVATSGINKFAGYLPEQTPRVLSLRFPLIVMLSSIRHNPVYRGFKRLLDIVISFALLVVLFPVFAVLAVLVKSTSPRGPIFYPWRVLGRNRRTFVGYKFRTMVPNADQLKEQLMRHNEMTGPVFKMKNDPRVTPLGRILRKFSLDELPQLYSVLKGDMSLVGPRPPSRCEADQFQFWQRRKLSVVPGITCLWQISGRSDISSFDEWARLDLEYIRNASMRMDLAILLRTLPAVIAAKGAH